MKVVVYGANFGGRDDMLGVLPNASYEFHYFSERRFTYPGCQCHGSQKVFESPRKTARWHKINSHLLFPDADVTVWFDSNLMLLQPVSKFLAHASSDFCAFEHPHRDCTYAEGEEILRLRWESWDRIPEQLQAYAAAGYPKNNGLLSTRIVIRKNTPEVRALNELWWQHVERYSLRDQISLPYVLWELGVTPGTVPHEFVKVLAHVK